MNRSLLVLFLAALSSLPACRTYVGQYFIGSDDYVLASRDLADGRREQFRLQVRGEARLRHATEYDRERPFLGFQAAEIDKQQAERRGVRPYVGLQVWGVYPGSSAAEGGVLAGDVLLSIDGRETVYLPQVAAIEATLRADQAVAVKLLRGQEPIELTLRTRLLRERVTDEQDIELEAPPDLPRPFAGVTLRGIPAVWCERIFGEPRQAVVVTKVEVGSPAWLAGVRAGDVIDQVDGAPVPPVAELMRRVAEQGPAEQPMTWTVRRGHGQAHEGRLDLHDYSGESNAWVPLVFYYRNGTYEDRWTVGPFGLLLSNRNDYIADASTRRVQTRNVFSALFGLFRVESSPEQTEVRLLWLIRFDT